MTPTSSFCASTVRPSPRLSATCAWLGRPPPGWGSLEKWNSNAPGVFIPSSTGISRPFDFRSRYCSNELPGISAPTW